MKFSISSWRRKYLLPAGFVVLFAAIGIILLIVSRAATPFASIAASSGTITSPASSVSDSKASSGSYVQFGTAKTTTSAFAPGACNPSPCVKAAYVAHTISVADSDAAPYGTANPKMITQNYSIERPANLATSPAPPVVFAVTGHPAISSGDPQWIAASALDKFVVVKIPADCPTAGAGYCRPTIDRPGSQVLSCGTSGTDNCDSIPLILGVLKSLECPYTSGGGSSTCQGINPKEVFVSGGSAGSNMTEDVACDSRTSSLFAGTSALSGSMYSPTLDDVQNPPNCPALLGVGPHCIVDCQASTVNHNISLQWVYGTADAAYEVAGSPFGWTGCPKSPAGAANCLTTGIDYSILHEWYLPVPSLAQGGSNGILGKSLGCPASPASTISGAGQTGKIVTTTWTPCSNSASPTTTATQTVVVTNGQHVLDTWPCGSPDYAALGTGNNSDVCSSGANTTDSNTSDGLSDPQAAWNFWTKYFP